MPQATPSISAAPPSHGRVIESRKRRHVGLYAYRAEFVARYCSWPPCPPEEAEQLEQLRVLWHGERIVVCVTEEAPASGVDTPEDLERVRAHFSKALGTADERG